MYATITAMDAWGNATTVIEGNGVTLTRNYDEATGLATSTTADGPNNNTIAEFATTWDGFGNLAERDDVRNGSTETATYDALNRLKTTSLTYTLAGGGTLDQSFTYTASGNRTEACANGDCTTYGYGGSDAGPHAVTSHNGDSNLYVYDADGEMTSDDARNLTWTAFGKAESITDTSSGYMVSIAYGPDEARYQKQLAISGVTSETVTYLGAAEVLTVNGNTSIRRTLSLAGIGVIDTGGYGAKVLYPVTDNLGSVVALSNGSGSLAVQMTYGPFGRRKHAGWYSYMGISTALNVNEQDTDRGYTGQEELDSVGLVDYNARLYDPSLGRFLSVDPLIAHPESTQGINPYSYVENNPLNKTDPTGEARCPPDCGFAWDMMSATQMSTPAEQAASNNQTVTLVYSNGSTIQTTVGQIKDKNLGQLDDMGSKAKNSTGNTNVGAHSGDGFGGQNKFKVPFDVHNALAENGTGPVTKAAVAAAASNSIHVTPSCGRGICQSLAWQQEQVLNGNKTIDQALQEDETSGKIQLAAFAIVMSLWGGAGLAALGDAADAGGALEESSMIKVGSEGGETAGRPFPSSVKQATLRENPDTCVYCRMKTDSPQVDHAIPRARGGNASPENAQTTCPWCNASKGAREFPVNPPPPYEGPWPPSWWDPPGGG